MKKIYILLPILFVFITGCETTKPKVNLTPLDIQSMQSRSYEHSKDLVFPSVMSVFQDLGYSINSADINTGLITAESAANSDKALKFWLGITKVSQTKANAFIEEIGNENIVYTKEDTQFKGSIPRRLVAKCCIESLSIKESINKIIEVTSSSENKKVSFKKAMQTI